MFNHSKKYYFTVFLPHSCQGSRMNPLSHFTCEVVKCWKGGEGSQGTHPPRLPLGTAEDPSSKCGFLLQENEHEMTQELCT